MGICWGGRETLMRGIVASSLLTVCVVVSVHSAHAATLYNNWKPMHMTVDECASRAEYAMRQAGIHVFDTRTLGATEKSVWGSFEDGGTFTVRCSGENNIAIFIAADNSDVNTARHYLDAVRDAF
jgi:hypothetical protein